MKKRFAVVLVLLSLCLPVAWASGPVNPNTASVEELSQLTNIGPAKAQAIVADREENGPFRSVQELTRVSGIGERTVEMNLDRIQLD